MTALIRATNIVSMSGVTSTGLVILFTADINTSIPTYIIIKEAISEAIVSARKWPYRWSSSGGRCEIRNPINTATEAMISVVLLGPSALKASEFPRYPAVSLKILRTI